MTQFRKSIEIAPNNRNRNLIWGVLLGWLQQRSEKDSFLKEHNWLRVATELQLDQDSFSNALISAQINTEEKQGTSKYYQLYIAGTEKAI